MTPVIFYDACHDGVSIEKKSRLHVISHSSPIAAHDKIGEKNKWAMFYYHLEKVKTTTT